MPTTFTVTNLNDSGAGSLRQAMMLADVSAGADMIEFQAGLSGTINLNSTLVLGGELTINGPGALTLGISGGNSVQILRNNATLGKTYTNVITGLSFFDGLATNGGAIFSEGDNLVVSGCIFLNNAATSAGGAIYMLGGEALIDNCTFIDNSAIDGGAVHLTNIVGGYAITDSTFSSNAAFGTGGALWLRSNNSKDNVIARCTIADNGAQRAGGGFFSGFNFDTTWNISATSITGNTATQNAGGLYFYAKALSSDLLVNIDNSTISGNSAGNGGGGVSAGGVYADSFVDLDLRNCTVTKNTSKSGTFIGAGVARSTDPAGHNITINGSIVSDNIGPGGVTGKDVYAPLLSTVFLNHSAVGGPSNLTYSGSNNLAFGIDLKLGPLASNGGPTQTHLPAANSPVRDGGPTTAISQFDQRGTNFHRAFNGVSDIGAVELVPAAFVVTTDADTGKGSLRTQIIDANRIAGFDTITFDASFFSTPRTIMMATNVFMNIEEGVTIIGPGSSRVAVDGLQTSMILSTANAPNGQSINISGMTFQNAKGTGNSGAVFVEDEVVQLNDVHFVNNETSGGGGAINVLASFGFAKLIVNNSSFVGNKATFGGAIRITNSAVLQVSNSTFSSNSATDDGGAIFFNKLGSLPQAFLISNTTFSQNSAPRNGAISLVAPTSTAVINNSTIYQNAATEPDSAGGIGQTGSVGKIVLNSTIVSGNTNSNAPDIFSTGQVKAYYCAIGSTTGATITGNDNLAFGTSLKLGALQNNGGTTKTHQPAFNSPLVNAGSNPSSLTNDQRGPGYGRVRGQIDIGAVEAKTDFFVTTGLDSGFGSLRQAVLDANAFAGMDNIHFTGSLFNSPVTITLTTGAIALGESVNIISPGAHLVTINANNNHVIFDTILEVSQTINLLNLTLTGGLGGAIAGFEDVITLNNCVLTGNKSLGAGGAIRLTGAAIYGAALNLNGTTISGNSAATTGGGVYLSGRVSVNINGSTLSGNTATGRGGALYFFGGVGTGGFTVRNSTISGNKSDSNGGGLAFTGSGPTPGNIIIQNSTITNNTGGANLGGGISQTSGNTVINLESSIVFGNSGGSAPDILAVNQVKAKTSALGLHNGFTINDLGGNLAPGTNPLLGPLANNGGLTQTHAIAVNSPALNKGSNPAGLATDQRGPGYNRVQLGGIDIGALEAALVVDTTVDENDGNYGAGDLSLREAIVLANGFTNQADTITFDPVVFASPQTITLNLGEMAITDSLEIDGPAAKLSISGNNTTRIFKTTPIAANTKITFLDLTLTGGNAGGNDGGAIFGSGFGFGGVSVTLTNCQLTNNTATNGGAVTLGSGTLTIIDSTLTSNTATGFGGAIHASFTAMKTVLRRSTISGNTANSGGGANIDGDNYQGGFSIIEDCTIANNQAIPGGGQGGGLVLKGNSNTIRNSTISGNSAPEGGGISLIIGGTVNLQNSTVAFNSATVRAGGIQGTVALPQVFMESSIVSKNSAPNAPDIFAAGPVTHRTSSIFSSAGVSSFINQGGNRPFGEEPMLGTLANNGGPTMTHALLPGSPLIDTGSNPVGLFFDQRGESFVRDYNDLVDIGAYESQPMAVQPAFPQAVTINDGSAQRSRVTSLTITFTNPPTLPPTPAEAFELKRQSDGAVVSLSVAALGNSVTITFTGGAVDFGSLADGRYTLRILAAQISNLDGDNNGMVGDDFQLVGNATNKLFRLFGDSNGDGTVTAIDFNAFRLVYGTTGSSVFDFENNNSVTASDFNHFRTRYGVTI